MNRSRTFKLFKMVGPTHPSETRPSKASWFKIVFLSTGLSAALTACSSPKSGKTHDPTLLDDKVTAQRVSAAVQSGGPELKNVKVTTSNSHVVLSGTVQSAAAKDHAESLAKGVPRVTHLDDNIEVSSAPSPTGRQR